jgi:hypothetical protein
MGIQDKRHTSEAELAEEFREYLKLIGEEVSSPIKQQANKHEAQVNQLASLAEEAGSHLVQNRNDLQNEIGNLYNLIQDRLKNQTEQNRIFVGSLSKEIGDLRQDLNENIKLSLQAKAREIESQFEQMMSTQTALFDEHLNKMKDDVKILMELYEIRTRKAIKDGMVKLSDNQPMSKQAGDFITSLVIITALLNMVTIILLL